MTYYDLIFMQRYLNIKFKYGQALVEICKNVRSKFTICNFTVGRPVVSPKLNKNHILLTTKPFKFDI